MPPCALGSPHLIVPKQQQQQQQDVKPLDPSLDREKSRDRSRSKDRRRRSPIRSRSPPPRSPHRSRSPHPPLPSSSSHGRDKDRDRSHRRRSHSRSPIRSRSRSRDRYRRRSRDRFDDGGRRRERSRSRSRDRDRDRHRHRRRSPPPPPYRSRDRRGGGGGGGGGGRHSRLQEPASISLEEEQKKLERTYRTVQVYNLNLRADERDIFEFFRPAGDIVDIRIIKDRISRKSKGFAYVEFKERESVMAALGLSQQPLMGQPVMVKMSEAEKNLAWEAAQAAKKQAAQASAAADAVAVALGGGGEDAAAAGTTTLNTTTATTANPPAHRRLLVENIPANIVETDLRQIFDPFGAVENVTVQRDAAGVPQGTATVQYYAAVDAEAAAMTLNEAAIELAPGMPMRIIPAVDGLGAKVAIGNGEGVAAHAAAAVAAMLPPAVVIEDRIDDDAGGGIRLTAQQRYAVMSKLAVNAGIDLPQVPPTAPFLGGGAATAATAAAQKEAERLDLVQGVLGPASPIPTQCLLLKNMFTPEEETEDDWDHEIAEEVKEECAKFGHVLFVHVDKESKDGFVYLKFDSVAAASAAQKALHGRWFNQKQLRVDFQFAQVFNAHFRL